MRGYAALVGAIAGVALLTIGGTAAPAGARAPTIAGTIALAVSCATDPERTTIVNNTDAVLDLAGFQLMSVINRRPGVAPLRLSGTLPVGAARVIETGPGAAAGAPTREFMYADDDPNEGARLGTPYGTLTVLCRVGSGSLPVAGGAAPTAAPSPTPSPRPVATPSLPGLPNTGAGGGAPPPGALGPPLLLLLALGPLARPRRARGRGDRATPDPARPC